MSIDILERLREIPRGNRLLLVITDRFIKLVKTVQLKAISAQTVVHAFVHKRVFNYGAPVELLADNGCWFTSILLTDSCHIPVVWNLFATT